MIRTREPDIDLRDIVLHDLENDLLLFIEATLKCSDVGVYAQHNTDVLAMLKHLLQRLDLAR
jgi:hypothetical protein